FGPAGIFAAWVLARAGAAPLVLERGRDVDRRTRDAAHFWQTGRLDPASNVQFGEGGAGTFSDGKLTARSGDPRMRTVVEALIAAGAPEEIRYLQKPHIGTDILRTVVKNLRAEIIRRGGTVRFEAQATGIERRDGRIAALVVNGEERIPVDAVFMGIGHSARDTYAMLHGAGVAMAPKAFAVGVRIEHPQDFIDRMQYGAAAGSGRLPTADYALTYRDEAGGRGVYSFCMCPGGTVVAAASEEGGLATNGMSNYRRDSGTANSALLVQVSPADWGGDTLGGIRFQRALEARAFRAGGGDYCAPVQAVGDFLARRTGTRDFAVRPTYAPGVRCAGLHEILPSYASASLARALRHWGERMKGFGADDVPLTGVEPRSSAPCRIVRDALTMEAEGTAGLYPVGEGAGYAGGIMSAALDGMKAALAFLTKIQ
ncbi:NAD(P)/FAD-dependent oxidoreductase, partial [Selenomonas sp. F0473]